MDDRKPVRALMATRVQLGLVDLLTRAPSPHHRLMPVARDIDTGH